MEIYHPKFDELLREMRRVRREKKRNRLLWGLGIFLVLSLAAGWFVFNRYYTLAVMRGPAMGETLPDGALVLVRRTPEEGYRRGDILLYERDEGWQMKRMLAGPEDRVVLSPYSENPIRVNGEELQEPYTVGRTADAGVSTRRLTLESNEYFVAGDQRSLSVDSRNRDYGTIAKESIVGRADFILWPIYLIGEVNGGEYRPNSEGGSASPETPEGTESTEAEAEETGTPEETAAPAETDAAAGNGVSSETDRPADADPAAEAAASGEPEASKKPEVASETAAPGMAKSADGASETQAPKESPAAEKGAGE